ncbi:SURF1 family cytochrome oxidase biogenesis protein [Saccharopolyspora sp. TS4A08]|uniref:SURF1-like protein n=1 Tax=Saccharopolyspora ipomoeae TaxID=3042027 RepID=A0ABT6PX67_9PSEU|nr:SURF1 family cytochrome oxidase biogenesis protein [Saccharopolyspora sp. TS4A08]MDI2032605.1 SURF1 family cytochrome oxidase biogenesis protein [Saccharopolyspora sp. TS4A08]
MRLKFLLRPGWLGAIALVVVFAGLCFTTLAPWQFGRSEEAEIRNKAIAESFHAAPKPIDEVLPAGRTPDVTTEWSQVLLTGEYLHTSETLAWQRTVLGEPAFEVITPFRLDDGTTVLVDRGFVRPVDGTRAPDYAAAPSGRVTLTARIRADETDSKQRPLFDHDGHRWAYAVNSGTISEGTGLALRPGYAALSEGQPGVLGALPLPRLESGPYFSYALQWIAFGIMAIITIGYLIYTELRPDSAPAWRRQDSDGPEPGAPEPDSAHSNSEAGRPDSETGRPGSDAAHANTSSVQGSAPSPATSRYASSRKSAPKRRRKLSVAEAIAEEERREAESFERNSRES